MTRVAVIGNAAGGKSTLCRQLSHARKLPYFPVDKIQWRPGWHLVPESERQRYNKRVFHICSPPALADFRTRYC